MHIKRKLNMTDLWITSLTRPLVGSTSEQCTDIMLKLHKNASRMIGKALRTSAKLDATHLTLVRKSPEWLRFFSAARYTIVAQSTAIEKNPT
mmetsp:Transcript_29877/g.64707  ORF Transcript_29877/g.64707 Transcript_29877/m.64707 type:complete len:92 (-) Transcript_29877:594-869(-)